MKTVTKMLFHIDDIIAGAALLGIVGSTVAGVFFRYVLSDPLKWTEEVCLALTVWFVFIGGSSAMRRGLHVSIDFVVTLFPLNLQKGFFIVVQILVYAVLGFITVGGIRLSLQASMKITNILKIEYTYINMAVPTGCVLMMFHYARTTKQRWNHLVEERSLSIR